MSKFVPNSFQLTNAFVDEAMNKISDASVKIYLLIVRKTRGWGKESDSLSLSQLEELSRKPSGRSGINLDGFIVYKEQQGNLCCKQG